MRLIRLIFVKEFLFAFYFLLHKFPRLPLCKQAKINQKF
jgi:hypothetical protein